MGKRFQVSEVSTSSLSERLAAMRTTAGFSQAELAAELGISPRMVAYYECPKATPPARLFPAIDKVDPNEKHQVLQLIDAFIERGRVKHQVGSHA